MRENDCPQCGAKQARVAGVEVWGVYDGALFWQCLDCGWAWHRWAEGRDLRQRAEGYVEAARRAWAAVEHAAEAQRLGMYDDCRLCGGTGTMRYSEGDVEGEHACPYCG